MSSKDHNNLYNTHVRYRVSFARLHIMQLPLVSRDRSTDASAYRVIVRVFAIVGSAYRTS